MLFPVQKLLDGRDKVCSIKKDEKVREALTLMIKNDFSQLPVVDNDGNLIGLVSEQTVIRKYYHLGGYDALLDLPVDHFHTQAITLSPDSDLFEALDRLKNVYAVIVTKDRKPVGILTNYDTTNFFRNLSEGLVLVEDIEVTLRQYIEAAFVDDDERHKALIEVWGAKGTDPTKSKKDYERLTFGDTMRLITHDNNWPQFKGVFEPKDLFEKLLDPVREIRNQLAHFRGRLEVVQYDALVNALHWLSTRPKLNPPQVIHPFTVTQANIVGSPTVSQTDNQYELLRQLLLTQPSPDEDRIQILFQDIERFLGQPLPDIAREHRSWWSNDGNSAQSQAWLNSGWRVEDVDKDKGAVTFRRRYTSMMQLFFTDTLKMLKAARPGVTQATKPSLQSWFNFGAGRTGFAFGWVFGHQTLRVELYIDTKDRAKNKAAFDALKQQSSQIEEIIGTPLEWERLDTKQASRIYLSRPGRISDSPAQLDEYKRWLVDITLKFVDAFQPRIRDLKDL